MVVEKVGLIQRCLWLCNTIFHQIYAVVAVYIVWTICYNYKLNQTFPWHLILSTISYVPLMGEAILLFSTDNVWTRGIERKTKYYIHGGILITSAILVSTGIGFMIAELGPHASHFSTTHGSLGFASWVFVLLSQCLGLAAANAQSFSKFIRPIYIKFIHNFLGMIGFILGVISLCFGMNYDAFTAFSSEKANNAIYCLLGITTVWAILAALKSAYNQITAIIS